MLFTPEYVEGLIFDADSFDKARVAKDTLRLAYKFDCVFPCKLYLSYCDYLDEVMKKYAVLSST